MWQHPSGHHLFDIRGLKSENEANQNLSGRISASQSRDTLLGARSLHQVVGAILFRPPLRLSPRRRGGAYTQLECAVLSRQGFPD